VKVAVTGATGTLGTALVAALQERGDEVAVLSRSAARARETLGSDVDAHEWPDPAGTPAPAAAFEDCTAVINLMGEPVAQRWSDEVKDRIRSSRVDATQNLVTTLRDTGARLKTLVSQSATGYYGSRGDERLSERSSAGDDFLAKVCVDWEAEAMRAEETGLRVATIRTGVVLSESGGALAKMLPFFKAGIGGPVAGGKQYVPWIHSDDVVGSLLYVLDSEEMSGPVNATAPEPVTNRELSKTLGRVLRRPAFAPVPAAAIKTLYGEMATIVVNGARVVPDKLSEGGYEFAQPELEQALRSATGKG